MLVASDSPPLERLRVGQLSHLLVQRRDALALAGDASLKFRFLQVALAVAVDQACQALVGSNGTQLPSSADVSRCGRYLAASRGSTCPGCFRGQRSLRLLGV
jgi:hypothetical protein